MQSSRKCRASLLIAKPYEDIVSISSVDLEILLMTVWRPKQPSDKGSGRVHANELCLRTNMFSLSDGI